MKWSIARPSRDAARRAMPAGIPAPTLVLVLIAAVLVQPAFGAERRYMVAAANHHAALAGIEMLARGGSAADAAVAVQMVLGLVEPQSSGIGGGAFLLHYGAGDKRVRAYDGRERAPASAGPDWFIGEGGEPMGWREAALSGRSVGAPGVVALLATVHEDHGRLEWRTLFEPAIRLARGGFAVSERLNMLIGEDEWLATRPATRDYFFTDGPGGPAPLEIGHILANEPYAAVLERIAEEGPAGFYDGPVAQAIVDAVAGAEVPGGLTPEDLASYQAVERAPVCLDYRAYRVCGMPPPTSGGVTTLQILGLVEGFEIGALEPGSAGAVHLISEASRLAFADRALYLADPDFVDVPVAGLLARDYLAGRASAISPDRSMGRAEAGEPAGQRGGLEPGNDGSLPATSHFSIVDAQGNAVSMTTSIESAFGSHLMASGFLLNNQLTDFSFRAAEEDGRAVANRVEGGKRPRSSMSPTVVLDREGNFVAALGSPGGSRIIGYVAQALIGVLDWDLTMREAVSLPHHVNRNGATDLEQGTAIAGLEAALAALGHEVAVREMTSGLHGIMARAGRLEGGADPRREGVVLEGVAAR